MTVQKFSEDFSFSTEDPPPPKKSWWQRIPPLHLEVGGSAPAPDTHICELWYFYIILRYSRKEFIVYSFENYEKYGEQFFQGHQPLSPLPAPTPPL